MPAERTDNSCDTTPKAGVHNFVERDTPANPNINWWQRINGRILLSFAAIALATMVAGGIGLLNYQRIEAAFRDVSDQKIPAMALALQLVEQTRALSADALTLAASSSPEQHNDTVAIITAHKDEMRGLLITLSSSTSMDSKIEPVETLVGDLFGALLDLERRVEERLELAELRQHTVNDIDLAHGRLLDWLTPKIDDANFNLVIRTEETTSKLGQQIETLMTDGVAISHGALNLRASVNLLAGIMIEAAVAPDLGVLEAAADRFEGARAAVEAHLAGLAGHRRFQALNQEIAVLLRLGDGNEGIFAKRRSAFNALDFDPTVRARGSMRRLWRKKCIALARRSWPNWNTSLTMPASISSSAVNRP